MDNVKTIEEFFIKKYEELEEENKTLGESLEFIYKREADLIQERDKWKNKYYELFNKLKEDLEPNIRKSSTNSQKYIDIRTFKLWEDCPETYEYYKNLFNLKEEGEEENEQSNSN